MTAETVRGRLVLDDAIVPGEIVVEDGVITAVEPDERAGSGPARRSSQRGAIIRGSNPRRKSTAGR